MKFFVLVLFGLIFVSGCVNYQGPFTVYVEDAVAGQGVEGVKVLFYVSCPPTKEELDKGLSGGQTGDPTCGGLYEKIVDGETDKEGIFTFNLGQKLPPVDELYFTLEKDGYDTGERGFSFFDFSNSGGYPFSTSNKVQTDILVRIIPDSAPVNKEKALQIAESDERVKDWKAKFKKPEISIFEMSGGQWEVYYSSEVFGAHLSMLIEPKDGKISSYEESDGGYEYIQITSQTPEAKKFLQKYPNASISVDTSGALAVDYRIDYFDLKGYCDQDCYYPDPYLRLRIFIIGNSPGKIFVQCYNEQNPKKEGSVEENVLEYLETENCLSI